MHHALLRLEVAFLDLYLILYIYSQWLSEILGSTAQYKWSRIRCHEVFGARKNGINSMKYCTLYIVSNRLISTYDFPLALVEAAGLKLDLAGSSEQTAFLAASQSAPRR